MRVLSVVAQKGGQAKSTLCAHLTYAMREAGLRIAVIDIDPQGSLSTVTYAPEACNPKFAPDVTLSTERLLTQSASVVHSQVAQADLIFFTADHENLMREENQTKAKFRKQIANCRANLSTLEAAGVDCVLIDTPGNLNTNVELALHVATHIIMPFQFGGYDIAAIDKTLNLINQIRSEDNPQAVMLGLLACRVETGSPKVMKHLREVQQANTAILPFYLANRVAVQEAALDARPIWYGAKTGAQRTAAKEWKDVCISILSRLA